MLDALKKFAPSEVVKVVIVGLLALVWTVGLVGSSLHYWSKSKGLETQVVVLRQSVQAEQKLRKVAEDLAVKERTLRLAADKKYGEENAKLDQALAKNPSWADERVPADVLDALGMFRSTPSRK